MPSTEAKALFLAGAAWSALICFSTSQLETLRVPPYRPGLEPSIPRAAWADADVLAGAGGSGRAVELTFAVDS